MSEFRYSIEYESHFAQPGRKPRRIAIWISDRRNKFLYNRIKKVGGTQVFHTDDYLITVYPTEKLFDFDKIDEEIRLILGEYE